MLDRLAVKRDNTWEGYEGENFQEFWESRKYEDAAEQIALNHLLPPTGGYLVDLGANYGRLLPLYSAFHQVILTDGAKTAVRQAKRNCLGVHCHCIVNDLRTPPLPSNFFDVVVTVGTFHHLPQVAPAFSEAQRLLKKDGLFIFEFANKRNVKQVVLSEIGRSPEKQADLQPAQAGNYIAYHPQSIMNYLNEFGFECDKRLGVSIFRWKPLIACLPHQLLVKFDSKTQALAGEYFLSPSIFIRAKKL